MRKLAVIFVLMAVLLPVTCFAANSAVTQTRASVSDHVWYITLSFTADDTDGSIPSTTTTWPINGYVMFVSTDPGSTAPTDNYDIVLNDADGVDIMGAEINNRSTSVSQQALPKMGNGYGKRYVSGKLTMVVTNQSVNSATGDVMIYIYSDEVVSLH